MQKLNLKSRSYIKRMEQALNKLTALNKDRRLCRRELLNQIEIIERNLADLKFETRDFKDIPKKYLG